MLKVNKNLDNHKKLIEISIKDDFYRKSFKENLITID